MSHRPPSSPWRASLLLTLALPVAACKSGGVAPAKSPSLPSSARQQSAPMQLPLSLHSENGVLDVELDALYAKATWDGSPVYLRTYNGGLVGPTLRVKPGDTLKVHLVNKLPAEDSSDMDHDMVVHHGKDGEYDEPHGFNTTNLHTHGLWVSPSGVSDNVLLSIAPGQREDYVIEVPKDHHPGTFWYHPHKHGSVALQVGSGMAGALIVEGGLDDVPEIKAAKEQIFVLQQFSQTEAQCKKISPEGVDLTGVSCLEGYDDLGPTGWAALERPTSVNGQVQPTLTLRPGEVQNWRFIHAGLRESIDLALVRAPSEGIDAIAARLQDGLPDEVTPSQLGLVAQTLHITSQDGIAYGRIDDLTHIKLEPGYRADALVKVDEPGRYELVDLPSNAIQGLLGAPEQLHVVAYVNVEGDPLSMALPASDSLASLAPYKHVEDNEITGCQQVTFKVGKDNFTVNGRAYDPGDPACKVPLGQAQEWHLDSEAANHPFHIHVNPFEIQTPDANGHRIWKDTLLVEKGTESEIRTRYERYDGTFVLHCHILDHEDQGMMENVEVMENPPPMGSSDTRCVPCPSE